ncbi:MAG: hypothetical protein EOO23_01955 [Comamonadaceae bacterium]|nr:MAG: hypothetical protein EOO23_01955 [Comamonadaceae bacterium]
MDARITGWMECVEPSPGNHAIFDQFEILFIGTGRSLNCALFSRETQHVAREHIYLLTPTAAAWAGLLPGHWTDAGDPRQFHWRTLIANGDAAARFALPELPKR